MGVRIEEEDEPGDELTGRCTLLLLDITRIDDPLDIRTVISQNDSPDQRGM